MFTDLVDFTALGQRNESLALSVLEDHRKLLRPIFKKDGGREIKTIGDGFLVDFPSALNAVRCAYDIQKTARESNRALPFDRRMHLRIGVHIGDILESGDDISGDAVNVASRIVSLADEGGVCVTRQVRDLVQNKIDLPLRSLGTKSLRNVAAPMEVFKVEMPWEHEEEQTAPATLDPSRIAVLPFANMSPDPNDSYFADGITEEIISTLSNVGGLSVISRTSVMGYKGTTKRVKEIGGELEAGSVLEGSFRKSGNKIRVTTQLIAVNNDKHVWAQSYDRNLDDVFTVQTEIAKQVADALSVRILAPEKDRIAKKPTESSKAYSLYLRGRYHWSKRGLDDFKTALQYFKQAVAEDPNFALGYVGLADVHELLAANWSLNAPENHAHAIEAVGKALELDENLAEAHATRGLVLTHDFELNAAEDEFKRAIALKPSYASAHQWYYHVLMPQMRFEDGLKQIEKAVELDPFSLAINLNHAQYYLATKDYAKALELLTKASELDGDFPLFHWQLGEVYWKLGQLDQARREVWTGAELVLAKYPVAKKSAEAIIAIYENDKEKMEALLPELEKTLGTIMAPGAVEIAAGYIFLGNMDKGFEYLEKSYERKEFSLMTIQLNDAFDPVHDDPRYQGLLEKMKLVQPKPVHA